MQFGSGSPHLYRLRLLLRVGTTNTEAFRSSAAFSDQAHTPVESPGSAGRRLMSTVATTETPALHHSERFPLRPKIDWTAAVRQKTRLLQERRASRGTHK